MSRTRQWGLYLALAAGVCALVAVAVWRAGSDPHTTGARTDLKVLPRQGYPGRYTTQFVAMGTDVRLEAAAAGPQAAGRYFAAAADVIERIESLMSTYRPDSEVSQLNRTGEAELSEPTLEVLRRALEVSRLSGGAFDVTYSPLRDVWRQAEKTGTLPTAEELDVARRAVGYQHVRIDGSHVSLARPGMSVDLGGIAKGYAIDRAVEAMQNAGAQSGLVDIGGDVRLFGPAPGRPHWLVKVRRPPGENRVTVLALGPCAVTTSGDYERGFRVGERWFSHIIDPRTGRPRQSVPSVTVVAADATTADALATALSVLEVGEGLKLVDGMEGVECMIGIRAGGESLERHFSRGFANLIREN